MCTIGLGCVLMVIVVGFCAGMVGNKMAHKDPDDE